MGRGNMSKVIRMNQRYSKRKNKKAVGGHSLGGREKPPNCYYILYQGRVYHIELDRNENPVCIHTTPQGIGEVCGFKADQSNEVNDVQLRNEIIREYYKKL